MLLPLGQVVISFTVQRYVRIAMLTKYIGPRKRLGRRIINEHEFPLGRGDAAARTTCIINL